MDAGVLADFLRSLLGKATLLPGTDLDVLVIANPRAGGFTRRAIAKRHLSDMNGLSGRAALLGPRRGSVALRLERTERRGHAYEMARDALAVRREGRELLIVCAGGDGTAHEIQSALMDADAAARSRTIVLRLPMGTGNDGSDGRTLVDSLGRLLGPSRVEPSRAILASARNGAIRRYAFNIASIGLDAYVTHMTNKLKGVLPSDSSTLWLDIASVFYDKTYDVSEMEALYRCAAGTAERRQANELVAMGVTGRRTYGSNVLILPDDDNVCAIRKTSIARKLALKKAVAEAAHRGMDEVEFFRADRVEIRYDRPVLAQFDGETLLLGPADFPFVMELTEPSIRTIVRA